MEIAHRLVHKNYQSIITRVIANTSDYDLRRSGQNAIIRNKDTELHSCSKCLQDLLAESGRAELNSHVFVDHATRILPTLDL